MVGRRTCLFERIVEKGRRTCLLENGDQYEAEELVSLRGDVVEAMS